MSTVYYFLAFLVFSGLIGYLAIRRDFNSLRKKRKFANEFLSRFIDFANSVQGNRLAGTSYDHDAYAWLTDKLPRIQDDLGRMGTLEAYRPPFANYAFRNYQLLPNTIPNMRTGSAHENDIAGCEDILRMHIGRLKDDIEDKAHEKRNPLVWLLTGIRLLIVSPLLVLSSAGAISSSRTSSLAGHILARIISAIVFMLTVAASIITIFGGRDAVLNLIRDLLTWIGL